MWLTRCDLLMYSFHTFHVSMHKKVLYLKESQYMNYNGESLTTKIYKCIITHHKPITPNKSCNKFLSKSFPKLNPNFKF